MKRAVTVVLLVLTLALSLAPILADAHCNLGLPNPVHCDGNGSTSGWIAVQLPGRCVGFGGDANQPGSQYVINQATCP